MGITLQLVFGISVLGTDASRNIIE